MSQSVTPPPRLEPAGEMSLVGYAIAAGALVVLLPVLPFLAMYWLASRLGDLLDVGGLPAVQA